MKSTIAFLFVFAIAIGLVGSAYAHKSEVVGDYKIEIGWKNEPPVVGVANEVEIVATIATDFDKAQADSEDTAMKGMDHSMNETAHDGHDSMGNMTSGHDSEMNHDEMSVTHIPEGLLKNFEVTMEIGDQKTPLTLVEDSKFPGVYHAAYTPAEAGFPMVHIVGKIADKDVEKTFHPEKVEGLNVLPPLKQIKMGVASDKIECREGMSLIHRPTGGNPVCVKHSSVDRLVEIGWMK